MQPKSAIFVLNVFIQSTRASGCMQRFDPIFQQVCWMDWSNKQTDWSGCTTFLTLSWHYGTVEAGFELDWILSSLHNTVYGFYHHMTIVN